MEKKVVNLELFCVTNKPVEFIENSFYKLAWVGSEKAPKDYIRCDMGENIFFKEKYYHLYYKQYSFYNIYYLRPRINYNQNFLKILTVYL